MIRVTRRDRETIYINPDLIETIEGLPDTHLTLTNGNRHLVLESPEEVVARIVGFKAGLFRRASQPLPRKRRRSLCYR